MGLGRPGFTGPFNSNETNSAEEEYDNADDDAESYYIHLRYAAAST